MSFDLISAPDGTAHGQCVNIPGQSQIRKTVGMALPPSLRHCARGLDITVTEHFISIREYHPSVEKMVMFLSFLLFKGTETVTAGILTSGFSLVLLGACARGLVTGVHLKFSLSFSSVFVSRLFKFFSCYGFLLS